METSGVEQPPTDTSWLQSEEIHAVPPHWAGRPTISQQTRVERERQRQYYRDEHLRQANRVGRSMTCLGDGVLLDHVRCRGEDSRNGAGCLCECHDPGEATS